MPARAGPDTPRRTVALLATGGTIASVATAAGGSAAELSPQHLLDGMGGWDDVRVEPVVEVARVNSWDVDPRLMWTIAARIDELAAAPSVDGVVVTHGTDAIEETAFVADIITRTPKPVVFVGAMRAADALSADGPGNLRTAVLAAADPAMVDAGVAVCLGGELHAARWVRKVHSYRLDAMASPGHAPLATTAPNGKPLGVELLRPRRWAVDWAIDDVDVDLPLVAAYPGMPVDLLRVAVQVTAGRGLVLEGFGAGHVPACVLPAVRELVNAGVVVVVATRVLGGGTWPLYAGPGGGVELQRAGVLAAGDLSAGKARLLLMACLAGADARTAGARFVRAVQVLSPRRSEGDA